MNRYKKHIIVVILLGFLHGVSNSQTDSSTIKGRRVYSEIKNRKILSSSPNQRSPQLNELEMPGEKVYDIVSNSIVKIYAQNLAKKSGSNGSGIVFNDSLIITNYHVVSMCDDFTIKHEKLKVDYKGKLIFKDIESDIAILQINSTNKLSSIEIGTSGSVQPGSTIYAVGSPFEFFNLITKGIVSGKWRDEYNNLFIIHDASLASGNSGGALINKNGELVGMNVRVRKADESNVAQNLNFAIPVKQIQEILDKAGLEFLHSQRASTEHTPQ